MNKYLNILILFVIHQTVIGNANVSFERFDLFEEFVLCQIADRWWWLCSVAMAVASGWLKEKNFNLIWRTFCHV